MLKSKLLSVSILAVAIALPMEAAWAQTYGTDKADEIVVTARKKEETLAEVPLQVSVFGAATIETRDFRDLNDLAQSTPGLEYENYVSAGLSTAPVIRGMSQTFTTSRIQNTAAFLDGVYLQRQSMVNPGLMEMERVEVVKGPQSAVYGRNAFSGAINYISKAPSDEMTGTLGGTVGSDGRYDYKASISGPLVEDVLKFRFSYGKSEFDGHTDNNHPFANSGPSDFGANDKLGGWDDELYSGEVTLNIQDALELGVSYYRNQSQREPQGMYYLTGARGMFNDPTWAGPAVQGNCLNTTTAGRLFGQPTNVTGNHAYCGELPSTPVGDAAVDAAGFDSSQVLVDPRSFVMDSDSELLRFTANADLSERFSLSYLFAHVEHSADGFGISQGRDSVLGAPGIVGTRQVGPPFAPVTIPVIGNFTTFNANPQEILESQSHEVRVAYDGDKIDARVGAYASNVDDSDNGKFYFVAPCDNAATCGVSIPNSPGVLTTTPPVSIPGVGHGLPGNQTFYEDNVLAVFADINWDFDEEWTLIAEARYEVEKKNFMQTTGTFGNADLYTGSETFEFFTPRATVRWTPTWANGNMMYGLVAKGVKTGGFNPVDLNDNANQQTFKEESNWTYEIGGRGTYFDGRFSINGAAYYIDWRDIQGTEAPDSINPFATDVTGNIGDAEVWGVEFDGFLKITENLGLDYTLSWLDPKYKNAVYESAKTINADGSPDLNSSWGCTAATPECNANGDVSGNTLERTSTRQASLGINYTTPINLGKKWDLAARIDFNYRNKMYVTPLNLAHNGSRVVSNANLSLSDDHLRISFWGKNIFNEEYVANSFALSSFTRYIVGLGAGRTFGVTAAYDF